MKERKKRGRNEKGAKTGKRKRRKKNGRRGGKSWPGCPRVDDSCWQLREISGPPIDSSIHYLVLSWLGYFELSIRGPKLAVVNAKKKKKKTTDARRDLYSPASPFTRP